MSQEVGNQSPSDLKTIPKLIQRDAKEFRVLLKTRSEIGGSSQDIQYCEELKSGDRWIVKCSYNAMATPEALADLSQQLRKPLTPYFEEYKEWLGLACYQLFSITTPEIALGEFLPAKTEPQDRIDGLNYGAPCLHVMSKFMPGFQEYGKGIGEDFLARYREWAQTKKGYFQFQIRDTAKTVPLKGFGAMLAVACFIYDLDCLGNSLGNAGFRIQTNASGEYAETIKIDPGYAFSFLDESSCHDARDRTIQFRPVVQDGNAPLISFLELTIPDQDEFSETARRILQVSKLGFKTLIDQVVGPKSFTKQQADELLTGLLARKSTFLNGFGDEVNKKIRDEVWEAEEAYLKQQLARDEALDAIEVKESKPNRDNKPVLESTSISSSSSSTTTTSRTREPIPEEDSPPVIETKGNKPVNKKPISPLYVWGDIASDLAESKVSSVNMQDLLSVAESKAIAEATQLEKEKTKGAKPDEKTACRIFQKPAVTAHFTGRETTLEAIAKQLHEGKGSVITQGISGLGGVGKTQIAARFAQLASEGGSFGAQRLTYQAVIWLHAEYHLDLQFIALAEMWLNKTGLQSEEAVKAVYRYLENKRVLLVFDNAIDKDTLSSYLPPSNLKTSSSNKIHILITSRNREWQAIPILSVDCFSLEEAAAFVKKRLPLVATEEIQTLLKTVSTLPLALSHAVAYITEGHCTVKEYPQKFALHQLSLGSIKTQADANRTVLTTFLLTFLRIRQQHPVVVPILEACAYLAPENIPVAWLETALSGPKTAKGGYKLGRYALLEVRAGLAAVQRHALLQSETPGLLNMHRLLQQVIRHQLRSRHKEQDQIHRVLDWITEANPDKGGNQAANQAWRAFLPHLEAVIEAHQQSNMLNNVTLAIALFQVGHIYLHLLGQSDKSRMVYERALKIFETLYGQDHFYVVSTLANLGNAYGDLGNVSKQRELLERALKIDEAHYGPDHFQLAPILGSLGNAYGALGNVPKQRELLERTLKIFETNYGPDYFQVAVTLGSLANAYGDLGNIPKKCELLERALKIFEAHYGSDHFQVAAVLGNLGNAYGDLGNVLRKRELLERALKIFEAHYGPDHFQVASALTNLGNAYGALGDVRKQHALLERALAIKKAHYGPDHFQVALTLGSLGIAYGDLGNVLKKCELLERALKIEEAHYGPNHFRVASTLMNLGNAYGDLGNVPKKRELLERALKVEEAHYGPDHFQVASTLVCLGNAYSALGDVPKQRELLERVLKIKEAHYGPNHFEVARTLGNLGIAYGALGNVPKKRELLEHALKIYEAHYGPMHAELAITLTNLAATYHDLKQSQTALNTAQRTYRILMSHPDYDAEYSKTQQCLKVLQSYCGFTLKMLQSNTAIPDQKQSATSTTTTMSSAQLLSQQGLANKGIQQAQQQLGRAVLALIAAINSQRKSSWSPQTHASFAASVVNAVAEGKANFQQLCVKPEQHGIPAELATFIQSYVAQHPELYELSTYPDFTRRLRDDLIVGKLDELHTRFSVIKPEQKAVAEGSNVDLFHPTPNTG